MSAAVNTALSALHDPNIVHALHAIGLLFQPGDVFEIRALEVGRTAERSGFTHAGYFNVENHEAIARALRSVDGRAEGVYLTLNRVDPALLARAANQLKGQPKNCTADHDIIARRWLYVDADAVRPAGISSTDAEHQAALDRALRIRDFLDGRGWPEPIYADSGNGAHLVCRLPALELEPAAALVKACLRALAARFNDAAVKVDEATFNAARICKFYGTLTRKGDAMPDRPHRRALIITAPDAVEMVPVDLLEALAAEVPPPARALARPLAAGPRPQFDIDAWLSGYGSSLEIIKGPELYDGGRRWLLRECLFNREHEKPAILELAGGALVYKCLHQSCAGNDWKALRRHLEPDYKEWTPQVYASPKPAPAAESDERSNLTTQAQQELPTVYITNRQLREISREALAALQQANNPPFLFGRSGQMVSVIRDEKQRMVLTEVSESALRGWLTRTANYIRVNAKGKDVECSPPIDAVRDVLALPPAEWNFLALDAVVEAPILRPDGSVLDTPGYDSATRLYYAPDRSLRVPALAERPNRNHLDWALNLINTAIGEFPYAEDASKANAIAALLTPIIKPAIDAPSPLALFDAPQAGTGKSLLAEVVSIIATGRPGEMFSAPRDEDEWRKQITTALMRGASVVVIDNITHRLDCGELAKALTETLHADRAFRTHLQLVLPVKCAWIGTGNNIHLGGDMPRRCYWVRLDAQTSRPFLRTGFKIDDLKAWTVEHRGELLGALLTLARAWYVAGRRRQLRRWAVLRRGREL